MFKREPIVLNRIKIRRVGRQEFLGTARPFNELAGCGGLMEAGVIVHHNLSRFERRHSTLLYVRLEESGITGSLEDARGGEPMLLESGEQTHALGAMTRFLAPARFPPWTPAVRASFVVIHPRLIQIHALLQRKRPHLLAKLLPQRFVSLGIAKGLFLCV